MKLDYKKGSRIVTVPDNIYKKGCIKDAQHGIQVWEWNWVGNGMELDWEWLELSKQEWGWEWGMELSRTGL